MIISEKTLPLIERELERRADFWRESTNDPHNIANAVMTALLEVRGAIHASITEVKPMAKEKP